MLTPIQLVNQARESINECDNQALCQAIDQKKLIIDVREPDEYANGYIANAINIPRGLIEFAILSHPKVKPLLDESNISKTNIFIYCKSGGRSALAAQSLQSLGFEHVYSLQGGIQNWEAAGFKINKEDTFHY
ncbi:rhodanese-like domain-containing protein [Aliikangiella maris]|uniref:Rhodanese-like domain-containing protein n=2 Tax=Aliikangiella maris TaxID=3162458 RepID=A0ABV2BU47_9GAMM